MSKLKSILKQTATAFMIGCLASLAASLFLRSCAWAIQARKQYTFLVYFLPLAGAAVTLFYQRFGREVESGNALILEEIHHSKKNIPIRMVPMIFLSTTISHLFGASVGREGVGVQMGAGIADYIYYLFKDFFDHRSIMLMTGMSAGFSAIFGTPLAGAIFGIEVLNRKHLTKEAIYSCLLGSFVAYYSATWIDTTYTHYPHFENWGNLSMVFSALILGCASGLIARLYLSSVHFIKKRFVSFFDSQLKAIFCVGLILSLCFLVTQSDRYLSLGEDIIQKSFEVKLIPWDFLMKVFSTALSVGGGFKGGEVMSLFFIGATLGNSLSALLYGSLSSLSALGFICVFAGATNVPLTAILLACELFGWKIALMASIAALASYAVSGPMGIYSPQREHWLFKI